MSDQWDAALRRRAAHHHREPITCAGEILRHGCAASYRAGCRCVECCAAKSRENARRPRIGRKPKMPHEERLRRQRAYYHRNREERLAAMNARRRAQRAAMRADRSARREQEERAWQYRAVLLADARAAATGELARLVAEQEADDRYSIEWSVSYRDELLVRPQWDDPTADAALARLAS